MALRAVFLDAGNTLVGLDYATIARCIGEACRPVAAPAVRLAEARARVRLDPDLAARSTETADVFSRYVRYMLAELGITWSDGGERVVALLQAANPPLGLWSVCLPEAPGALDALRALGLRLAVVSNSNGTVARILEGLDLARRVDAVVDSAVVGFEKPDPRIFRLAMTRAGVTPERSVYVGDNPEFDVDPALAVGMFPVLIDRRERFADAPGARITAMGQLPALLGVA